MASYYADFSLGTNGHAGTNVDPWSYAQAKAFIGDIGDVIYAKNGIDKGSSNESILGYKHDGIKHWTTSVDPVHGDDDHPWRVKTTGTFGCNVPLFGGIVFCSDFVSGNHNQCISLVNMYLIVGAGSGNITALGIFGSIIVINNASGLIYCSSRDLTTRNSYLIQTSALSFDPEGPNPTFTNCVLTLANYVDGVAVNCQFGWTPPSLPAWDAARSAFLSTTLSVGINTPPEPGVTPYTWTEGYDNYGVIDYSKGLFNSTRTGIGAVDFTPASVAPVIDTQPVNTSGNVGQTATFTVVAHGTPSVSYIWQKNITSVWTSLTNSGNFSGVNTLTLSITNTTSLDNGTQYRCIISNGTLPDATSTTVTLTVITPVVPIPPAPLPSFNSNSKIIDKNIRLQNLDVVKKNQNKSKPKQVIDPRKERKPF